MSYSIGHSPILHPLLGDDEVLGLMSAEADISACALFEMELAAAQAKHGRIGKHEGKRIVEAIKSVVFEGPELAIGMARDGVFIPAFVARLREALSADDAPYLHKDATSQDVIDTSFMIRASAAFGNIEAKLNDIDEIVGRLVQKFATHNLMGRTRMQAALPIPVKARLTAWESNVDAALANIQTPEFHVQFSGPVGTHEDEPVQESIAEALGLTTMPFSWHTDRSPMIEIGNACAGVTGHLGKIGADIALMAQNEFGEIKLRGGGTSSAMPHKQNPVKAEVLVSLARFNASLLSALHNAAVHEQERSGAAWTLEWMVLPQMVCAAAGSARLARELLESIESIGT